MAAPDALVTLPGQYPRGQGWGRWVGDNPLQVRRGVAAMVATLVIMGSGVVIPRGGRRVMVSLGAHRQSGG